MTDISMSRHPEYRPLSSTTWLPSFSTLTPHSHVILGSASDFRPRHSESLGVHEEGNAQCIARAEDRLACAEEPQRRRGSGQDPRSCVEPSVSTCSSRSISARALAVNILTLVQSGYKLMEMAPNWLTKRPYVAEHDLSGVVVDANGSEEFKVGDEVYGWIPSSE